MSKILSQLFVESFVRGLGKTSGTLITMFVGWQMFKITNGHDDFLSFLLGKRPEKRRLVNKSDNNNDKDTESLEEIDHEEVNLEDMQEEQKFKSLFDKF
jgi:hypothetical protein